MEYDEADQYWIWLSSVEGVTPKRMYALIDVFKDAKGVWENISDACKLLPEKVADRLRASRDPKYFYSLFSKLEELNAAAVTLRSERYPQKLRNIYDPPATLYTLGGDCLDDDKMFAIVGSRVTSDDGKRSALSVSEGLAEHGVSVVSGMAAGIDTYAHMGCLNGKGRTVAVLGCGIDIVYPKENNVLRDRIIDAGGEIVSEYPPSTKPYAANFPARNRIISGLSRGVLMVEGKKTSGALITVNHALDQGKDVFAIPGSIYSVMSEGPNGLIRDGAIPLFSYWDVLEFYRWGSRPKDDRGDKESVKLNAEEKSIYDMLKIQPMAFGEILNATGFNSAKLNSVLTILEMKGIIKRSPGRIYRV